MEDFLMNTHLICYPKCSTCRDTEKYLKAKGIDYSYQDIKKNPPTVKELKKIHKLSKLPLKRLFNTSGNSYRALNLKETYDSYSEQELFELLSKDGMLIKRPLIVTDKIAIIGFNKEEIDQNL